MGQAELVTSKPVGFPPYRRSHLRSQTYLALVRIFSHLPATTPDNGGDRMGQENHEKGSEFFEFVGSDFMDSEDPLPHKRIQGVHETVEEVGEMDREFGANNIVQSDINLMTAIEEVQDMSMQVNDFNEQQRIMDELELVVKGAADLACDNGSMPLNSGLEEKQNGSSEVELMGYQVENVEFRHASELQVQDELNQLVPESVHPSLVVNVSTSTKGQTPESIISPSSERQKKEMELVSIACSAMESIPNIEDGEFETEEQCSPKVTEATLLSFNQDMTSVALNACEDRRLLDSTILKDNHEMQSEENLEKSSCAQNASNSSNISIDEIGMEEGEIVGDFGMDDSSSDMSIDEVQMPSNIGDEEKKQGYDSNSFTVNAHQDDHNSGQAEPRASNKVGEPGSELCPGNNKDQQTGSIGVTDSKTIFAQNLVLHKELSKKDANQDHRNSSMFEQMVDVNIKRKRGPESEARKAKRKERRRKKRAEKNLQDGVKRLKLPPVQISKTINYCRHYRLGRCHEGDKCQFSHDMVPLTKSKPCCHFARQTCMKGDDCPFDHQLSKYPCDNFVSKGFCSRHDACLFSHQLPTKEDIPTPSRVCRPELKSPLLPGNTSSSKPLNNHGCSSVQKNRLINSMGIPSRVSSEHKVTSTVHNRLKQLTPAPKGVSFFSGPNSSLPSPSTPKQGLITPNKEILVQIGTLAGQCTSGTNKTLKETPKKLAVVAPTPTGVNFLSFGKGSVCNFKRSTSSLLNENGIKLPQLINFGLSDHASSSLDKVDYNKAIDGAKQSVLQTDLASNENFDKSQTLAERIKSSFPGKATIGDATTDLQGCLYSYADHSHSKSVQEVKRVFDDSQTSSSTLSMLLVSPFVLQQSSEHLAPRNDEHASNSGQRALLSTLAFAAEHDSDIKMKDPAGASPVCPNQIKESNNSNSMQSFVLLDNSRLSV